MDTTTLALFILSIGGMAIAFTVGHNSGLQAGLATADKAIASFNNNPAMVNLVKAVGESVPPGVIDALLGGLTIVQKTVPDPTVDQLATDLEKTVNEVTGRTPAAESIAFRDALDKVNAAPPAETTTTTTTVTAQ